MERYRSGHNEAVLKTVCPKGRVGSNPTLSAETERFLVLTDTLEKYPSWPKGLPWKGSRSLIAARGFKSLLLRLILSRKTTGEIPVVFYIPSGFWRVDLSDPGVKDKKIVG